MSRKTLNLGILAHVDAGKTTLTERLLYEAGAIDEIGSVDAGTTQTDSLALEQQRGITIRSAVASFSLGDVHVNLIDTPGHPDFIAEVERVLSVLDGAVLVISAVEGVQPQTRILMRALQRLRIPTLFFVNKTDRLGADEERVLGAIAERLTPAAVPIGSADDPGFSSRLAEMLSERDDGILAAYVENGPRIPFRQLRDELVVQTRRALVHPTFFGSAITGAGVEALMAGIAELLAAPEGDEDGPVSGTVFKIERGANGEKIAYVRMFSGTLRVRDRVGFGADTEEKVTAIAVFEEGPAVERPSVSAGDVAKLWGLGGVRIGDRLGAAGDAGPDHHFPPPTLESVVVPVEHGDGAKLRTALDQLADQDPLIDVRRDDGTPSVSLYGDVQKQVIQATLAIDYGIDVTFREATPLYVERPLAHGKAVETLNAESNPFNGSVGFTVDPAPHGGGIRFRVDVGADSIPLYVYKTRTRFTQQMDEYVRDALRVGPHGWQVIDCAVTLTECAYTIADGPPSRRGPLSTAADFRKLTPLVLAQALEQAGTVVCEPTVRARLEIPTASVATTMAALGRLGALVEAAEAAADLTVVTAVLSAVHARDLQRHLPSLTGGEGVLESTFAGHQPVVGEQPTRNKS